MIYQPTCYLSNNEGVEETNRNYPEMPNSVNAQIVLIYAQIMLIRNVLNQ